jgi:hypothetical protein
MPVEPHRTVTVDRRHPIFGTVQSSGSRYPTAPPIKRKTAAPNSTSMKVFTAYPLKPFPSGQNTEIIDARRNFVARFVSLPLETSSALLEEWSRELLISFLCPEAPLPIYRP